MKQLFIARHARAEFDDTISDDERPLTARGIAECLALARAMSSLKLPELIICSAAKRTHETAKNLVKYLPQEVPILPRPDLYNASIFKIKEIIASANEEHQHLMLIGHNPGINQLVMHFMDNAKISREHLLQLNTGMVPSAVALFEFNESTSWQDCMSKKSKMTWFFKPVS